MGFSVSQASCLFQTPDDFREPRAAPPPGTSATFILFRKNSRTSEELVLIVGPLPWLRGRTTLLHVDDLFKSIALIIVARNKNTV